MTFLKTTIAAFAVISFASYAQAQDSGIYGGISVSAYVTNPDNVFDAELFTIDAKLGYNFNTYFGVEAQGSIGLNTDSQDIPFGMPEPATLRNKVDYSVAAFGVARLPITQKFDIFARAGVHNTQAAVVFNNNDSEINIGTDTETGVAVGAGGQFNLNKRNGLRLDYTYFGDTKAETLSLGYVRKF